MTEPEEPQPEDQESQDQESQDQESQDQESQDRESPDRESPDREPDGDGSVLETKPKGEFSFARPEESVLSLVQRITGVIPNVLLQEGASGEERAPLIDASSKERKAVPRGRGNYQLLGEIARGGMGTVLKGHDTDLGRDVAVKVLHEHLADQPEMLQRFVEEAQIGGQLQHPGIVPVYELGMMADDRPFFTMKLVKGRTLAALLDDDGPSKKGRGRFLEIFESICQTMAYAHNRGVIHRDLKPSNVMVGAFGEVQVVDWGLAKVLRAGNSADARRAQAVRPDVSVIETVRSGGSSTGSDSLAGSIIGTPSYMPPEQATGEIEKLDERSDVFSLGAILCQILTGLPPYAKNLMAAANADLEEALARLDDCDADPELLEIVRQCLRPAQAARPRSAEVLAQTMHEYLASVNERAHKAQIEAAEARVKAAAQRRSQRLTLGLAASVTLLVVLGSGSWLWVQSERTARAKETAGRQQALATNVNDALNEAWVHRGQAQWTEALAAVARAQVLVVSDDADEELRIRVADRRTTLESEYAESQAQARFERDAAVFLSALRNIRQPEGNETNTIDWEQVARDYAAPFEKIGIDPEKGNPETVAAALRELGFGSEVALFLDEWTEVCRKSGDESGAVRLLDLAHLVDPDPMRADLREAILTEDRDMLRQIAESDLESQPPTTLHLLGTALGRLDEREAARSVLRTAVGRHPDSDHLQLALARLYEGGDEREKRLAIGHYQAVLALRPESLEAEMRLGRVHYNLDEFVDAREVFERLLERRPDDGFLLYYLGTCLMRIESEKASAEDVFRRSIEASQAEWWVGWASLYQGHYFWYRGEFEESTRLYRRATEIRGGFSLTHDWLGCSLREQGDLEGALASFERTVQVSPTYSQGHYNLGNVQLLMGNIAEALKSVERSLDLDPRHSGSTRLLGVIHQQLGNLDESREAYRRYSRLNPDSADTIARAADSLQSLGDLDGALEAALRAVEVDSRHLTAMRVLISIRKQRGENEEALKTVQRARAMVAADDPTGLALVASDFRSLGDLDAALEVVQGALDFDPNHIMALKELSIVQWNRKETAACLETARRIVALSPGSAEDLVSFARYQRRSGNLDGALVNLERALAIDPELHRALVELAGLHSDRRETDAAIEVLSRMVDLNPDDAQAHNSAAWILATCQDEKLRAPDEAVRLARRAVELQPGIRSYWNTLGTALWRAGEFEECVTALERSMELANGGNPHDWLVLAIAFHKLGNDKGPEMYQRSLVWISENGSGMSEDDRQLLESFRKEAASTLGIADKTGDEAGAATDGSPTESSTTEGEGKDGPGKEVAENDGNGG